MIITIAVYTSLYISFKYSGCSCACPCNAMQGYSYCLCVSAIALDLVLHVHSSTASTAYRWVLWGTFVGEWGGLSGGCSFSPQHWGRGEQQRTGQTLLHRRSTRSGWSGFSRTTFQCWIFVFFWGGANSRSNALSQLRRTIGTNTAQGGIPLLLHHFIFLLTNLLPLHCNSCLSSQ